MTDSPASLDDFADIVCNLMAHFVLRQQLVVLAMLDLHPGALRQGQEHILGVELKPYLEAYRERRSKLSPGESFQIGVWKNDWEHFVHGIGCKLTHIHTREPIEWDGPDPQAFDLHWFSHHLAWRTENERGEPFVQKYLELNGAARNLKTALNHLIDQKRLFLNNDYNLVLVAQEKKDAQPNLPIEVTAAALRLIQHYWQRQQLVVDALLDLRPDIIKRRAEEPYTDPLISARLKSLFENQRLDFKKGAFLQKGVWLNEWDYEIRNVRCSLTHKSTGEMLTWAASDPALVERGGFMSHLNWRLQHESQDADVAFYARWMKQYLKERSLPETDYLNDVTGVTGLLGALINQRVIIQKLDDFGVLIAVNDTTTIKP